MNRSHRDTALALGSLAALLVILGSIFAGCGSDHLETPTRQETHA